LHNVLQNPLARMVPLQREQFHAYRLGEKLPPSGELDGYAPTWEAISMVLAARGTLQARVDLKREFTLLGITSSASVIDTGGFRAQLYDVLRKRRIADRGVSRPNIAGGAGAMVLLREPYPFPDAGSQILVQVQNLEVVANTIQLVLYGVSRRFNAPGGQEFPGGKVTSSGGRP
jgi:hypothetical protein